MNKNTLFSRITAAIVATVGMLSAHSATASQNPLTDADAKTPVEADWWLNSYNTSAAEAADWDGDLIFFGDSITEGWRGNSALFNTLFGKYNPLNTGVSGNGVGQVLWQLENDNIDWQSKSPKLCVLMIGTNHLGYAPHTAEIVADGIKTIAQEMQKKFPKTKVLVISVPPRQQKPDSPQRVHSVAINKALPGVLKDMKGVEFLDIADQFLAADGTFPRENTTDFTHFTRKGYEIWGAAMSPKIDEMMK